MKKNNIILIGMRGSGKSTIGRALAEKTRRRFFDSDTEIEKMAEKNISKIILENGWKGFRKIESHICEELGKKQNAIIATGGGVILKDENIDHLKKNGVCVFLFADISLLSERIKKDENTKRPSLTDKKSADELWDIWSERRNLYSKAADIVVESHQSPEKITNEILEHLKEREALS